jgi:hypothetical protein
MATISACEPFSRMVGVAADRTVTLMLLVNRMSRTARTTCPTLIRSLAIAGLSAVHSCRLRGAALASSAQYWGADAAFCNRSSPRWKPQTVPTSCARPSALSMRYCVSPRFVWRRDMRTDPPLFRSNHFSEAHSRPHHAPTVLEVRLQGRPQPSHVATVPFWRRSRTLGRSRDANGTMVDDFQRCPPPPIEFVSHPSHA